MEKFIEKMEILLEKKECVFKCILVALTLVGLFFFFCSPRYWFFYPDGVIAVYTSTGAWILFAAWILRLIILWIDEENRKADGELERFLNSRADPTILFTRHDFVLFNYGVEFESNTNEYKRLGNHLRRWIERWIIEEAGSKGKLILYRDIRPKRNH